MTIAFFDASASPLVNRAASQAVTFLNGCKPAPGRPIDLAAVCLWSAQAVAPRLPAEMHKMLADATLRQIRAVDRSLSRVWVA